MWDVVSTWGFGSTSPIWNTLHPLNTWLVRILREILKREEKLGHHASILELCMRGKCVHDVLDPLWHA